MTEALYSRPTKTEATAVGKRVRARWTRQLGEKLSALSCASEVSAFERTGKGDRPRWVTARLRIDQLAVIEMLQARHLKATSKEISRAEALAALMAGGLERTLKHKNFGGKDY